MLKVGAAMTMMKKHNLNVFRAGLSSVIKRIWQIGPCTVEVKQYFFVTDMAKPVTKDLKFYNLTIIMISCLNSHNSCWVKAFTHDKTSIIDELGMATIYMLFQKYLILESQQALVG